MQIGEKVIKYVKLKLKKKTILLSDTLKETWQELRYSRRKFICLAEEKKLSPMEKKTKNVVVLINILSFSLTLIFFS